jgi:hypothetical protein
VNFFVRSFSLCFASISICCVVADFDISFFPDTMFLFEPSAIIAEPFERTVCVFLPLNWTRFFRCLKNDMLCVLRIVLRRDWCEAQVDKFSEVGFVLQINASWLHCLPALQVRRRHPVGVSCFWSYHPVPL